MGIGRICKLFEQGNVCVVGEKGSGKDMLFANVIARRKLDYISNTEYDRKSPIKNVWHKLSLSEIDCGGNTYKNFIEGNIKPYKYPHPLGVDVYIADVGVYFPSQFCNELNRDYKQIPCFMALSRHIAEANVHINIQNLNRAWDKLREQSRTYITCIKSRVIRLPFKNQLVIQKVRIYEKYQSCVDNVPVLRLPFWIFFSKDKMMARLYRLNYQIQHGKIKQKTLIYLNKSNYDTHIFRSMLDNEEGDI